MKLSLENNNDSSIQNEPKKMVFSIEEMLVSNAKKTYRGKYLKIISYIRYLQIKDELLAKRLINVIFPEQSAIYYSFFDGRLPLTNAQFFCHKIEKYLMKNHIPINLNEYRKLKISRVFRFC